jgi:hypothetical protein
MYYDKKNLSGRWLTGWRLLLYNKRIIMARKARHMLLIKKYLDDILTEAEKQELEDWRAQHEDNNLLFQQLTNSELLMAELRKVYETDKEAGWQKILQKITKPDKGI